MADDDGDALEIMSMGKLYQGPWENKYWSSSRGKNRHPYPVGYRAVRSYSGMIYKMEIMQGLRGPEFLISSRDGQSCSGQTPDLAWEGFQKKKCLGIKLSHGKRLSCNIDSVELFGFKNPCVQRLMRKLVSDAAKQSFSYSCFGNGKTHENHTKGSKTHLFRKSGGGHNDVHVRSSIVAAHKRGRSRDQTQTGDGPQSFQGIPSTSNADFETVVERGNKLNCLLSAEDGKIRCVGAQEASNSIVPENFHSSKKLSTCSKTKIPSMSTNTRGFSFSKVVEEEEGETQVVKNSQMLNDVDLYAPDSLDSDSEAEISKESSHTVNENSEKNNLDQEITTSMMTVLLPRAVPLLKKLPRKKRASSKSIKNRRKSHEREEGTDLSLDVAPPDLAAEFCVKVQLKRQKREVDDEKENVDIYPLETNLEDAIVADSFENDSCETTKYDRKYSCMHEGLHDDTADSKTSFSRRDHWLLRKGPPLGGVIPSSNRSEQKNVKISLSPTEGTADTVDAEAFDDVSPGGMPREAVVLIPNTPHSESKIFGDCKEHLDPQTCSPTKSLPHNAFAWPTVSNPGYNWTPNYKDDFSISPASEGEPQPSGNRLQDQRASYHDMTNKRTKMMHNDVVANIFELVGCFVHPMPISMVLLRTKGNDIFICVLCGYSLEKEATLFAYKAPIRGEGRGCPSLIGHTSIISPILRDACGREVLLDSSDIQFTPDGKCLVLHNSIRAPYCRKGNVNCRCSVCISECNEKNALKIVQVKHGYVQVLSRHETTDIVCCILVCEPSYLVAAEESGILHLWTMNSTWSAQTEENYLPTSACVPDYIVELKRIPNSAALVVGHNAFGDFCLWDLSRKMLVSTFSAPSTAFCRFLPINLFRCPGRAFVTATGACRKEQVTSIIDQTRTRSKSNIAVNKEDVSIVLLVSPVSDIDAQNGRPSTTSGVNPPGCWRLALLAKNQLLSDIALDPSGGLVGASAGYGIISTHQGLLYIWELSTGTKLGHLNQTRGGRASCFATDDAESGAFAVAVGGIELQVYSHSPRTNPNTWN